jgi:hypothetical protein
MFQTCRYVGAISATVMIRPLLQHRRKPGELGRIPLVMLGLSAVTFVCRCCGGSGRRRKPTTTAVAASAELG